MLKITYEYECDWCKSPICAPDTYKMAVSPEMPIPRRVPMLDGWHLCYACAETAKEALREKMKRERMAD